MTATIDKQLKPKNKDTQRVMPRKGSNKGFLEVRGTDGRFFVVDIEKAREAMRYAMRQDTEICDSIWTESVGEDKAV